jgi:hypothetical protein
MRRAASKRGHVPSKQIRTAILAVVAILTFYVGIRAYIRRIKKTAGAEPEASPS